MQRHLIAAGLGPRRLASAGASIFCRGRPASGRVRRPRHGEPQHDRARSGDRHSDGTGRDTWPDCIRVGCSAGGDRHKRDRNRRGRPVRDEVRASIRDGPAAWRGVSVTHRRVGSSFAAVARVGCRRLLPTDPYGCGRRSRRVAPGRVTRTPIAGVLLLNGRWERPRRHAKIVGTSGLGRLSVAGCRG